MKKFIKSVTVENVCLLVACMLVSYFVSLINNVDQTGMVVLLNGFMFIIVKHVIDGIQHYIEFK
jgi:hypothetical protein